MSENQSPSAETLVSAEQVGRESAAMAAHLHRIGIRFLPQASEAGVTRFLSQLAGPAEGASEQISGSESDPRTVAKNAAVVDSPSSPTMPEPIRSSPSQPAATASRPAARSEPRTPTPVSPLVDPTEQIYAGESLPIAERQSQLEALSAEAAGCTRCSELARCRTKTVFGEGHAQPRVVFFGEGPGRDEDESGRPFVGKAGQLLTKMIEACSFRREDVYILNTVKCRPPGNRNPETDEIENCREFFENQLSILRPEYIVCLGAVSSRALLKSKLSVGRLRGKFHRYFESKVLVTYHPAYLLRTPDAKKAAWDDLQLMLRDAGIDPRQR